MPPLGRRGEGGLPPSPGENEARRNDMVDSTADVWHSAMSFVELYGDRALALAEIQAAEMACAGDTGGADLWWKIAQAIVELKRTECDATH